MDDCVDEFHVEEKGRKTSEDKVYRNFSVIHFSHYQGRDTVFGKVPVGVDICVGVSKEAFLFEKILTF